MAVKVHFESGFMHLSTFRAASLALALTASTGLAQAQNATGAGASFPAPVYAKWADAYHKATGARVNYQSIGSGGGIKQIEAATSALQKKGYKVSG